LIKSCYRLHTDATIAGVPSVPLLMNFGCCCCWC